MQMASLPAQDRAGLWEKTTVLQACRSRGPLGRPSSAA